MIQLSFAPSRIKSSDSLKISGSKSESNRLLILQSLYPEISLQNLSNSRDTLVLQEVLLSKERIIDVGHAGTAMRFLTAYLALNTKTPVILQGSNRMHQRPIEVLVDALQSLGAKITYLNNQGYPPLKIEPSVITKGEVYLKASVSSQYITALMLIAPKLNNGLKINLIGKITSFPYLTMTSQLMKQAGFDVKFNNQVIRVFSSKSVSSKQITIESDWTSASYIYVAFLLSSMQKLRLSLYFQNSKQGDAYVVKFFKQFGIITSYYENELILEKENVAFPKHLQLDLIQTPDLAQTFAVLGLVLGIKMDIKGLSTLKIKETDRIEALKSEMEKLGAQVKTTVDTLKFTSPTSLQPNQLIRTYQDHRMAMAFALVAFKTSVKIEAPEVVEKSYPNFWRDLQKFGIQELA
ncbi:3-phosphoshikimate 1-carboxyvinyltransferase [Psychroflexus maritimus]|uniref:3-phosphoshikimate 1-carboxyvinyltransferase n=1 Tax=Psychroflexus maritimus TaxID=2714865 RepID=A0A967AHP1_9FLAO|nr:3-phosphoshikimate 1-carboxyvinyltransferase [Psychroflexus maritimus]NGZ90676.1 3-phosphoshikimate 1-carboxyvinyltransferase [Psychroflexus maritimus]